MSSDVHGFFSELGIELPKTNKANVLVRCTLCGTSDGARRTRTAELLLRLYDYDGPPPRDDAANLGFVLMMCCRFDKPTTCRGYETGTSACARAGTRGH